MCFSPQRPAIFAHRKFKKCSEQQMFCTFWLQKVLFATAACNFWFLLWAPTSAPAALTGLLFDWPDTRIIEKTQHFATSLTFGADVSSFFWLSRYCIFFLLTWLLYSAFQLSILSEVCYLNFLRLSWCSPFGWCFSPNEKYLRQTLANIFRQCWGKIMSSKTTRQNLGSLLKVYITSALHSKPSQTHRNCSGVPCWKTNILDPKISQNDGSENRRWLSCSKGWLFRFKMFVYGCVQ